METARELTEVFLRERPDEAARLLERLPTAEIAALFAEVAPEASAAVLQRMSAAPAVEALGHARPEVVAPVVEKLPVHFAASLFRGLDPERRDALRSALRDPAASALGALLRFPEGTAGALMDPRALALPEDLGVGEALAAIHARPGSLGYYVYVVSREGRRLAGVASLRTLMLSEPAAPLSSVVERRVETLPADAGRAAIVAHPGWRRFPVMPVVENGSAFVGAIRYETLRRLELGTERGPEEGALETVLSLGELCWIGFAGVLSGLATSVAPPSGGERKV